MSENNETNRPELIEGINKDAREEARIIMEKARQYVKDREAGSAAKLAAITREAEEKLAHQVAEIQRTHNSNIAVEKRKIALRVRDRIIAEITTQARARFAAMIEEPGYTKILEDWILEAALGLNCEKAVVNASAAEKKLITAELLMKIEKQIQQLTGREFGLSYSPEPPLGAQGVVVTTSDGHTAFNNQVSTRLLRYQSQLRKLIYDALFGDEV